MPLLEEVVSILDLEPIERNLFRGRQPKDERKRVFGGQVVAQALAAAYQTVERSVHSLHAYFIRGGDPALPIVYQVDRLRDGKSFSVRRVLAIQHGEAIFSMGCSFQNPEEGMEHQIAMPDVPGPESLASQDDLLSLLEKIQPERFDAFNATWPVEIRPVDPEGLLRRHIEGPMRHFWVRARGPLADDSKLHQEILAYASDMTLLDTSLAIHGRSVFDTEVQAASLDHAVWFHRPFRIDDWLLFSQASPSASGARGFNDGRFFSRDGVLVASVAQEGLIRVRN